MNIQRLSSRHLPPRKLGALWRGAYQKQVASSATPVPSGQKRSLFMPKDPKENTVYIMGPIIDSDDAWWFDLWDDSFYTTSEHVRDQLKDIGDRAQLRVNSPGGSVAAGAAIRLQLQEYLAAGGYLEAFVEGIDASASTLATQTANKVIMGDMASMFVHPVSTMIDIYGYYNSDEIRDDLIASLEQIAEHGYQDNKVLSRIYADRTGESPEDMLKLMKKEEWMGADLAVERGFAHEIFKLE